MVDGRGTESQRLDCEVGGVHHVVYKCTPNVHHIIRTQVGERGRVRDGRVFPYVAHYLSTGDMLYPAHEGEVMVSRLLEELTRLDLVNDLLHARGPGMPSLTSCVPRSFQSSSNGSRRFTIGGGDGDTLKVHTRRRRRLSFAGLLTHIFPAHNGSTSSVYRPPSNKGTTLVVVTCSLHRATEVTVHGPADSLRSLFPGTPVLTSDATYPLLDSRASPRDVGASDLLAALREKGYVSTVRSSWVVPHTGALMTQWLVYRRRGGWSGGVGSSRTLPSSKRSLHHAASTTNVLSASTEGGGGLAEGGGAGGTLRHRLRNRSKSIMSLATEHRPTLTLKRILSVLL
ncbi:uncharacterized protein LOC134766826 [Penaeus indicus]|uniref:uncharacterized protein LOC134766826 n=1 Tax=Penaeus indicus TaxID=29960 RepID=UPI00300C35FB